MAKTAVRKQPPTDLSRAGTRTGNGAAGAGNGRGPNGRVDDASLARVEGALRAAVAGDFSVRLPGRRRDTLGRVEVHVSGVDPSNGEQQQIQSSIDLHSGRVSAVEPPADAQLVSPSDILA